MLYRSLYATYENKDVVTEGITGKRFTVPEIVFDTFHPENVCFCREYNINPDLCFRKGILDMRSCLLGRLVYSHWGESEMLKFLFFSGAPILLSTPHFYMADPQYAEAFIGIEANKDWHETHFDLEPV